MTARTWVGDAPQGRAVRPVDGVHGPGRQSLRSRADSVGDYRQGARPPDPGAAGSHSAVRCRGVSTGHERAHPLRLLSFVRRLSGTDRAEPEEHRIRASAGEPARRRAEVRRLSRAEPAGPRADAGDRRSSADAEPGDHQLSRYPLSRTAVNSRRCRRARACRRNGNGDCVRHPSAEQPARPQIFEEGAGPFAGATSTAGTRIGSAKGFGALEAMAEPGAGKFLFGDVPTGADVASFRSSTMRGASTCRSTTSRLCCAPRRMRTGSRGLQPRIRTGRRCPHEPRRHA